MNFSEKVYSLTRQIPAGKVSTYGLIAKAMGYPKASRGVGMALRTNPNPIVTPCHRVVMSDGLIGGYMGGVEKKVKLLSSEGVVVDKGRVGDLKKFLFSDFKTLRK